MAMEEACSVCAVRTWCGFRAFELMAQQSLVFKRQGTDLSFLDVTLDGMDFRTMSVVKS